LNGENIMGKVNYMKQWMKFWQVSKSKWSKRSLSTPTLDWWKWWRRFIKCHQWIFELN
jgi:hypothetical protein